MGQGEGKEKKQGKGQRKGQRGKGGGIKGGGNQIEKCETLKGFIRPHLNFAYRLYVRCFWS